MTKQIGDLPATLQSVQGCMLAVLVWIAGVDGSVSPEEEEALLEFAKAQGAERPRVLVAEIGKYSNQQLAFACFVLRNQLTREGAELLIRLVIGMALQDRYLKFAENQAIRYLAGVVGLDIADIDRLFAEIAGRPFPQPGDPSSKEWWLKQESGEPADEEPRGSSASETVRALATLGLEPGSSQDEIRAAYLRLSKVHHPDRFSGLGNEAVQAATVTFQRIHGAYQHLKQ